MAGGAIPANSGGAKSVLKTGIIKREYRESTMPLPQGNC